MNVIIVGGGDIGYHLCSKLIEDKNNCTLIELNPTVAQKSIDYLDANVIIGSGTSLKVLDSANVSKADFFVSVTQNDELNMIACMLAKKSGAKSTIARIRNPEYTKLKSSDFGIDLVIHPEMEAARAVVHLVRQSSATDYIEFENGQIKVVGIRLDDSFKFFGETLIELSRHFPEIPFRILAVKRDQTTIIPKGTDSLLKRDQIYIVCSSKNLKSILQFFGKTNEKIENVMIIGGGLVGEYVAKELEKSINVKIIESNEKKANLLAENLDRSLVIHAEGTDIDLLMSEDLSEMNELIAVSGNDETNLIASMIALQMKVPRRIIMLKNVDYLNMANAVNADSVISKPLISVNVILQFIRKRKYESFAEIPGCEAVILEMTARDNSKITKKTLSEINVPDNVIFGAVFKRNKQFEIPIGTTQIQADDRVIVFYLPGKIKEVEKLF